MKLSDLPPELIVEITSMCPDLASLVTLAQSNHYLRSTAQLDPRWSVIKDCYQLISQDSINSNIRYPPRCMFNTSLKSLQLDLRLNAHRYALYPITKQWHYFKIQKLVIRGDLDLMATVKLQALLESDHFYCEEVQFVGCFFNDDEKLEDQPSILRLASLFVGKCKTLKFQLCTFDPDSLAQLINLLKTSQLSGFHFMSNFFDEFPALKLAKALDLNSCLKVLEVTGANLGWDLLSLNTLLEIVACTKIQYLTITNNDIVNISSHYHFPQLISLDLRSNPLSLSALPLWFKPLSIINPNLNILVD